MSSPFRPVSPFPLNVLVFLPRPAVIRAHLGATIIAGKEAQAAKISFLHQDRIPGFVKIRAVIYATGAVNVAIQWGLLAERPNELETGCHRRPAFLFVYAMSPPAASSSCMKGGTGATLNDRFVERLRITPASASTS